MNTNDHVSADFVSVIDPETMQLKRVLKASVEPITRDGKVVAYLCDEQNKGGDLDSMFN